MSRSLLSSFGVVPLATREWKPEIAPQAMVIKTKGNSLPENIGPVPSMNCVRAGILMVGCRVSIATANNTTTPSFRKVDK